MEGLSPLFSQMIRLMIMRAMLWIGGESEGAYCLRGHSQMTSEQRGREGVAQILTQ